MPTYTLRMIQNGHVLSTKEIEAEDNKDAYEKAHAFKAVDIRQGIWVEVTLKQEAKEPDPK